MISNRIDSANLPRSTFLAALCAFGLSCSSPAHDAMDALNVISPGCGSVLFRNPAIITDRLPDGRKRYFGEKTDKYYEKCSVVVDPQAGMSVDYYTEKTGFGVSDSCIIGSSYVECNGSGSTSDDGVIAFGKSISRLINFWLSPGSAAPAASTTTDMPASSVTSGTGL